MSQVADQIGRVVGERYRLESLCGTGSSAHVYRAFDPRLSRRVAVKLLHPGLAHEPSFLKRFGAEAKAAAGLNHPNIVRVLDWGEEEAGPFLVLEYMGGGSLSQIISRQVKLSLSQACHLGLEAGKALQYAHRQGLVHRDVKPANILFDEEGRGAIADFGLARALAEAAWTEPEGSIFGTARYTSPEQATGNSFEGRSDVYSLGLVLYEAITGESPFTGESTVSLLMARVGYDIPIPSEFGELGQILSRMLNPIVRLRIDSSELVDKLEELSKKLPKPEPLPIQARSSSSGEASSSQSSDGSDSKSMLSTDLDAVPRDLTIVGDVQALGLSSSAGASGSSGAGGLSGVDGSALYDYEASEDSDGKVKSRKQAKKDLKERRKQLSQSTGLVGQSQGDSGATGAKTRSKRKVAKVLTPILAVVVIGALVGYSIEAKLFVPKVSVPNVVGISPTAAKHELVRAHLSLHIVSRQFVKGTIEGMIASQTPRGLGKIARGSAVDVIVSNGPPIVVVPLVTSLSESEAAAKLGASGFVPKFANTYSLTVPSGEVIAYSPKGKARYGQVVTLEVSQGPQPETIPPSLAGKSVASATSILEGLGLSVTTQSEHSSTIAKGLVIGSNPALGQTANQGSTVTLIVSLGPVMVVVPNVNGDSVGQATTALTQDGFNPQNVYGPPGGTVFATNPQEGSSIPQGSSVSLYTN